MTDLLPFARKLNGWGAAVTAIRAGTKRPAHKWERWQAQPQTEAEMKGLPWQSAAALGIVNGSGGFRVFDIDAAKDAAGRPIAPVPEAVVVELLRALGLPDDYQWSYVSGSGAGFGVVVRCAEPLPDGWPPATGVYLGDPRDGRPFGRLELRWSRGQTVIDGAHPTGPGYRWRWRDRPFVPPALLPAARVVAAFAALATGPTGKEAGASWGSGAGAKKSRTAPPRAGYGAAALADAIRRVSTAANGDRNNTLFRQTAGLAELVNGGAAARAEVERAMTAAALAAGLTPQETAATIRSAFDHVGQKARAPRPSPVDHRATGVATADGDKAAPPARPRLDDIGNAERFVARHGDAARFDHTAGRWLVWAGTHWRRDDDGAVYRLAKETARGIYDEAAAAAAAGNDDEAAALGKWARASAVEGRLNALLNLARSDPAVAVTHERLNRGELLLNVQNGTLDLRDGALRPHDRADLFTYALPVAYDPAAGCPTWHAFIARITGGDDDMAAYLARAVGYTLSGSTAAQCLFFLHGRGANGKSTFIETVMALMGELATKVRSQVLMLSDRDRVPNEIAALAGRRLVVSSELADGGRLDEGVVKDLTGGDTISARFLYGEIFQFRPAFKLWLYGNHKPAISGTDDGIWRRVQLIPFDVQIPEAERDGGLPARLRAELPGVLAWAVRGGHDYAAGGLRPPSRVAGATADYRVESDVFGQFLSERCRVEPAAAAEAGRLYAAYSEWATGNGLRVVSKVRFGKWLGERGFARERLNKGHINYLGIALPD